jgi:hypothetical protein
LKAAVNPVLSAISFRIIRVGGNKMANLALDEVRERLNYADQFKTKLMQKFGDPDLCAKIIMFLLDEKPGIFTGEPTPRRETMERGSSGFRPVEAKGAGPV